MSAPRRGACGLPMAAAAIGACVALLATGCASVFHDTSADTRPAAQRTTPHAAASRSAFPANPFGDVAGEPEPPDSSESTARASFGDEGVANTSSPANINGGAAGHAGGNRSTAWSKIKGAIARTPAAVPLPPDREYEDSAPPTTADAREF